MTGDHAAGGLGIGWPHPIQATAPRGQRQRHQHHQATDPRGMDQPQVGDNQTTAPGKVLRVSASKAMGMAATPVGGLMERSVGVCDVRKNTGMGI